MLLPLLCAIPITPFALLVQGYNTKATHSLSRDGTFTIEPITPPGRELRVPQVAKAKEHLSRELKSILRKGPSKRTRKTVHFHDSVSKGAVAGVYTYPRNYKASRAGGRSSRRTTSEKSFSKAPSGASSSSSHKPTLKSASFFQRVSQSIFTDTKKNTTARKLTKGDDTKHHSESICSQNEKNSRVLLECKPPLRKPTQPTNPEPRTRIGGGTHACPECSRKESKQKGRFITTGIMWFMTIILSLIVCGSCLYIILVSAQV